MSHQNTSALTCVLAETIGTLMLVSAVVGSGIMGERLAQGNTAVALLANTFATVCALFVLIRVFGAVSGAHFNPLVSFIQFFRGDLTLERLLGYVTGQLIGAVLGSVLAHGMFELPVWEWSEKARMGKGLWIAEIVATAGLVLVILRSTGRTAPKNVAAYIGAAYWFTASTSFANPAATVGRMFTNTFAGIAPASVAWFVLAQGVGAVLGVALAQLFPRPERVEIH